MRFLSEIIGNAVCDDFAEALHLHQCVFRCRLDFLQIIIKFSAEQLCISQPYMVDAQCIDEVRQLGGFRLFHRCNQILIGFLPKALHGCDFRLMLFQAEQIRIIFHKALFQKLLQGFLRKPFHIHGISGNKMAECLYPLRGAVRISAIKRFAVTQLTDFRFLAADKAVLGNFRRGNRSRQIFRNLGNNHIRLIDLNRIPDAQLQFLQNADIMQTCAAHR